MEDKRLTQGNIVQLGLTNFYRFNHPTEAHRLRQRLASESSGGGPRAQSTMMFRSAAMVELHYREQLEAEKAVIEAERVYPDLVAS
jgi:hypothetical protein